MNYIATLHEFQDQPLFLAKKHGELHCLQCGRVYDLHQKALCTADKIFPFGDEFSAGEYPGGDFCGVKDGSIHYRGQTREIPDNSMVFGFYSVGGVDYCFLQVGILALCANKLIRFHTSALSCDYYGEKVIVGFNGSFTVYDFAGGELVEAFSQSVDSPVVEARLSQCFIAVKLANNEFRCYSHSDELLLSQQFVQRVCSLCVIQGYLFASNDAGEIVVFQCK